MKTATTTKSPPQVRLVLDAKTRARHEAYYANGDYQRIAEKAETNRANIRNVFIFGSGPASWMKAARKYYAEKERAHIGPKA